MEEINENEEDEIIPNLWIGGIESAKNINFFKQKNIKYVINLTSEIPNYFTNITYLNIPITVNQLDISESETKSKSIFDITNKFILHALKENSGILVHCRSGHNRAASIIAAFLMKYLNMDQESVTQYIKSIRPLVFNKKQ